jgi:ketosteroid isomerase-like protein
MRISVILAALAVCSSVASGQSAAASAVRDGTALADTVRTFVARMVQLLRDRDANAVIALYGDTTRFVHVDNGVVIPWAQLSRTMREYFANATTNPISLRGEPGVMILDRNHAVAYATHHMDAARGRPPHDGVWTGVLRRERTGWRIVHSHSSDRAR